MFYLQSLPGVTAIASYLTLSFDLEEWMRQDYVITIGQVAGMVAFVAGVVSAVALAVIGDPRFLGIALMGIPLGLINFFYMRDYTVIWSELQDRKTVEQSAEKVVQEGEEIKEGISRLEAQLLTLKSSKGELEDQVTALTTGNESFAEKLVLLQQQNEAFSVLAAKIQASALSAFGIGEKVEKDSKAIAEHMASFAAVENRETPEAVTKLTQLRARLEMIAKIYERTHILRAIKIEMMALSRSNPAMREEILRQIPAIERVFRYEFS